MELTLSKPPEGYEALAQFRVPDPGETVLTRSGGARKLPARTTNPRIVLRQSPRAPKQGEVWELDGVPYIVARTDIGLFNWISLVDGNRWGDHVPHGSLLVFANASARTVNFSSSDPREYFLR